MMKLAVIPARGGSKRIPGKNIKPFLGKPIIAYTIETAIKSNVFDKIIVSTDSEEIAEVAKQYGAEVPFVRPVELSDDFSGTTEVTAHAVQWYQDRNMPIELVCSIYATAPLLSAETLIKGLQIIQSTGKQYAFTVTAFPSSIHRAIKISKDNELEMYWPENFYTRSQDLEEAYHDAGQMYWGTPEAFTEKLRFYDKHSAPVIVPNHLVQDIDTPDDWVMAELLYQALQHNNSEIQ